MGRKMLRGAGTALGCGALVAGGLSLHWLTRPNRAFIHPDLEMEAWEVVADGTHNSNTDLIHWNDFFYLVHQASPWHLASVRSRLIVLRSSDAHRWDNVAEFRVPGGELRDPKFAAIGAKLFLYALKNVRLTAEPFTTLYTFSEDGIRWHPVADVEPAGWLFWRPKTRDSTTWYVPVYWHEHGKSALLESNDGIHWSLVSRIYAGEKNDETAIEFLPDGRIVAAARLEGSGSMFGDARALTLIAVASPPYGEWSYAKSHATRLDGPCLLPYGGKVFAIGRYQADRMPVLLEQGSVFSRKRTSLFLVEEDGLVYLSDLPSAGDTSYAGAAIAGDALYVCYYTSPIDGDYPWVVGMLTPTNIRMARIPLSSLAALAERPPVGG